MENTTIKSVKSQTEEGLSYGRFEVEPLDRGYGVTLGNSLRRVLLSDLEGAAITAVKIDGVVHEFSTIPGMVEDVMDVIMNLKQIAFKLHGDGPKTVKLSASGPVKVTAALIESDSDVEVVNPHAPIATLQEDGKLNIEMRIEKGKGFVAAEQVDRDKLALGWLPVDAIYMPVHKVNYRVENSRVGQFTNFDKLVLEVWTDGSIEPDKALSDSASILINQFNFFSTLSGSKSLLAPGLTEDQPQSASKTKEEEMNIEELELSIRAYNCLKRAGIINLADLLKKTERELMEIKNFGRKSAEEVIEKVYTMGYLLKNSTRGKREEGDESYFDDFEENGDEE